MALPIAAGLAGMGLQLGGGLLGKALSAGDRDEQRRLLRQILSEYEGISLPEQERAAAEQLGTSALGGISVDPALRQAQMDALAELGRVSEGGGMTLEDRANLARVQGQVAQQERAGRGRIAEEMASRGISGGGAELAMQLANQQGAAQRAATGGLETAAAAQRRALDAMLARGQLAGGIRGQEYGEKSRAAEAADAIARWNAASRQGAQQYNLGLPGQRLQQQLQLAGARGGARGQLAGQYGQSAADTESFWGKLGASAREGVAGYPGADDEARKLKR